MLGIILGIIIIAFIYILVNSYIKESGITTIILLFIGLIGFGLYILIGLQITKDFNTLSLSFIYWLAYTLFVITILNLFLIGYFWSVVRKKTGPYGIKGPMGDIGLSGNAGSCSVNSSQSFAIQNILQKLEKLFKEKRGSSLLKNNNEPINDYLNDKINSIITSNQYKITLDYMTSENIPLENLFTYMKNIFTIWFNLIYDGSNGDWFLDQYADENYDFNEENNPFNEIRKYDLYYWGMIEPFRRLNVEICSNNIDTPISNKEPRLRIIKSNDYSRMWIDVKSRAPRDAAIWKLNPVNKNGETYYPIGVVAQAEDEFSGGRYAGVKNGLTEVDRLEYNNNNLEPHGNGPNRSSILIAGDVKPPIRFDKHYEIRGSMGGYMWRGIAPPGYKCLADFWGGYEQPDLNMFRCIPEDCLEEVSYNWNDMGWYGFWNPKNDESNAIMGMRSESQSMEQNGYHIARSRTPYLDFKFYKIKEKCFQPTLKINNKDLEEQYSKMAIGWNGDPIKSGAKYSIFSLLGLMPEGIITHINTGRRYYIIHYGGVEINRYLVLLPNHATQKWDNSLEVNDDRLSNNVKKSILIRNKLNQQWKMTKDNNGKIYLVSYYNNKNLVIDLEPNQGEEIYSTSSGLNIKNYFNFVSSYGEKSIL